MKLKYRHTLPFFLMGGIHRIKITTDCSEFAARTDPEINLSLQLPAALNQLKCQSLAPKYALRTPHKLLGCTTPHATTTTGFVVLFPPA